MIFFLKEGGGNEKKTHQYIVSRLSVKSEEFTYLTDFKTTYYNSLLPSKIFHKQELLCLKITRGKDDQILFPRTGDFFYVSLQHPMNFLLIIGCQHDN